MAQQTAKKLSIKPLGNRVVAQRLAKEETLRGGIIVPDSVKKKPETARVVAIGPGALSEEGKLLPMPVAVGDTIIVDRYSGQEVTIDDEEYLIVRADEVFAIVVAI